jgi:hypothetical protein
MVETKFEGYLVEAFALNYLRAGVGKEAFAPLGEMSENNVGNNSVENGVAKKFEPLVVAVCSELVGTDGTVRKCLSVNVSVVGVKAK